MKKLLFILALVATILTVSCTPETLASEEQQVENDEYYDLPNG